MKSKRYINNKTPEKEVEKIHKCSGKKKKKMPGRKNDTIHETLK